MEKSFPKYQETNPNALRYAAASMLSESRKATQYDNSGWEAGDVVRDSTGNFEMADLSTRRSTFVPKNPQSSRVMDTLDEFQNKYYTKTGRDDIGDQVEEIKSHLMTQNGPKGLSASQSLPVINGTEKGWPINPYAAPYTMQVQYPVAQLDMDWYIRQCKNWDGLYKSSFKNIKYAREKVYNWMANFQTLTHIDTYDGPMHWLPWEDQEIYEILKHMIISEEEMINILKKLPDNSLMHKARHT